MDNAFLEDQKKKADTYLEQPSASDTEQKRKVAIVSQYISSLLTPDSFTDAEREDSRKLALELEYQEDTDFDEWLMSVPTEEPVES